MRHELFAAMERERIQAAESRSWLVAWVFSALLLANLIVSTSLALCIPRGEAIVPDEISNEAIDTANRLVGMAEAAFKSGDLDKADKTAHEAMLKDPTNHVCWLLQGNIHVKRGDWQESIECYQNARRFAFQHGDERLAHVASHHFDLAVKQARRAAP